MTSDQISLTNSANSQMKQFKKGSDDIDGILARKTATNADVQALEQAYARMENAFTSISGSLYTLMGELPDRSDEYTSKIDKLTTSLQAYQSQVVNRIAKIQDYQADEESKKLKDLQDQKALVDQLLAQQKALAAAGGSSTSSSASTTGSSTSTTTTTSSTPSRSMKPITDLKPSKLSRNATPIEFQNWVRAYTAYSSASNFNLTSLEVQRSFILACLEDDLLDYVASRSTDLTPVFGTGSVMEMLTTRFEVKYPIFTKRLTYFKFEQKKGQSFSEYRTALRQLHAEANIKELTEDDTLIFRILCGLSDAKLREKILELDNPTLDDVDAEALKYETLQSSLKACKGDTGRTSQVNQASSSGGKNSGRGGQQKVEYSPQNPGSLKGLCKNCGREHADGSCSARDKICSYCKKTGHFKLGPGGIIVCQTLRSSGGGGGRGGGGGGRGRGGGRGGRGGRGGGRGGGTSHARTADGNGDGDGSKDATTNLAEVYFASEMSEEEERETEVFQVSIDVEEDNLATPRVPCIIRCGGAEADTLAIPDSGATRTIISRKFANLLNAELTPTTARLVNASKVPMTVDGVAHLEVQVVDRHVTVRALVTPDLAPQMLISWHALMHLGILPPSFPLPMPAEALQITQQAVDAKEPEPIPGDSIEKIMEDFADVLTDEFDPDAPAMSGPPMKIHLKKNADIKPIRVQTARNIPVHLQPSATKLVDKLTGNRIIERIPDNEPTEWCSPAHFVEKPISDSRAEVDSRLVTDFVWLNQFVERPVHPFEAPKQLIRKLPPGQKVFARFDCLHGYFQVLIAEAFRNLTTFLLPSGRYRYCRAPMGLNASGDEFNFRSDLAVAGLTWLLKIVDDILVFAMCLVVLFVRIRMLLQRMREHGIKLSKKKFLVGSSVKFAGYLVTSDGIKPDPDKLKAIREFPRPKDLTALRSFLGLANQLTNFLPDFVQNTSKMRQLLKKNTAWLWTQEIDDEFEKVKLLLTSDAVVKPFDPSLKTQLLTDASRLFGLGYALIQLRSDGPNSLIACGSKSLTPTQQRYSTIEIELLAVKWAVEDNDYYLRGIRVCTVVTDHRPLVGIFAKPLFDIPSPRLRRFREALMAYNLEITWVAGKTHLIADALSRNPVFPGGEENYDPTLAHINMCVATDPMFSLIFDASQEDADYKHLADAITNDAPPIAPYKDRWHELSVVLRRSKPGVMVINNHKIIVPKPAQPEILRRLHLSHSGMTKTLTQARQLYYWKGMDGQIKQMIASCKPCLEHLPSQAREPSSAILADGPMDALSMDLFYVSGKHFLLTVDRFSGFLWIHHLKKLDTKAVLHVLTELINTFGRPASIFSDNGPQFRADFTAFCEAKNIVHHTSSPGNPSSNGLAESAVKSAKYLIEKCEANKEDVSAALLEWRNTPRRDGYSPAQAFFGRSLRTSLPALQQPAFDPSIFTAVRAETKDESRRNADKRARKLSDLSVGDHVLVQDLQTKKWNSLGIVTVVHPNGRSYEVETDDGATYRRNRRFLRSVEHFVDDEQAPPDDEPDDQPVLRRSARLARASGAE